MEYVETAHLGSASEDTQYRLGIGMDLYMKKVSTIMG